MSYKFKLNKVINKWLPRFKTTSILSGEYIQIENDLQRLKINFDDFIQEMNKATY